MLTDSWTKLDHNQVNQLRNLKDSLNYDPGYRVVPQSGIPDVFPSTFKMKCDSAVVMASTGAQGTVIFVCNARRVDQKAGTIDQEPFGIALLSTGTAESGLFLHHGDWDGRTTTGVPNQFWQYVNGSGVGNFCPGSQLPQHSTGPLSDLSGTSDKNAFLSVFDRLKKSGQAG